MRVSTCGMPMMGTCSYVQAVGCNLLTSRHVLACVVLQAKTYKITELGCA